MQMHGNEEYIKAFIEYGFHPLKETMRKSL